MVRFSLLILLYGIYAAYPEHPVYYLHADLDGGASRSARLRVDAGLEWSNLETEARVGQPGKMLVLHRFAIFWEDMAELTCLRDLRIVKLSMAMNIVASTL